MFLLALKLDINTNIYVFEDTIVKNIEVLVLEIKPI